ncbi:MAG: tetratricopeptide repeat protein [Candidatus Eremiobacteraeota bacterium]|nr:tetratricopeptide repeat protein [Candidatus Eremiobacteraeota bacterium]
MVRNAPPSGTLTFLFTDIEGSTRSWERDAAQMADVLNRHNALLSHAIDSAGGVVFKTVGDEFCAVFAMPENALGAAIEAQRQLASLIPVRMALHSGTAVERDGDYFGPTLNRVARLMAIGHGGQILVSGVTAAMLRDGIAKAQLRDLGMHRLRDLSEPERVFQAIVDDLRIDFPPLQSLDSRPHNLPAQLTTFVGREAEVRELDDALRVTRLLTLTGPGGIGKTRLALEVGSKVLDEFPHGVWFIDFSAIHDAERIPESIASALSLQEEADRTHWDIAMSYLRDKQLLLILDNCEHLVDGCAHRANEILQNATAVRVLATSREPLSVPGERLWVVPSLLEDGASSAASIENPAVQLFIDRAMLTGRQLDLNGPTLQTIGEICQCLDGIPLALELAASRAQSLTVNEILGHLSDRFRFLASGDRTRLPRQKTLRGAIDWSYELLEQRESATFVRTAVFTGEFGLAAAEAICADGDVANADVLDALSALVAKSFVVQRERDGSSRYRVLETLREYGFEKLTAQDEIEALRRRHFDYYVAYGAKLETHFMASPREALPSMDADYENLRAALAWGFESSADRMPVLQLATAVSRYWEVRAHVHEARMWFAKLLDGIDGREPEPIIASAFSRASRLANLQGDYADAIKYGRVALQMRRQLGDQAGIADSLNDLGRAVQDAGRPRQAAPLYREALKFYRKQDNLVAQARVLCNIGLLAQQRGEHQIALKHIRESLALIENTSEHRIPAFILGALGTVSHHAGNIQDALDYNTRSLELVRTLGDIEGIARVLNNLAEVRIDVGDLQTARLHVAECIHICEESGLRHEYADALDNLAILEQRAQQADTAVQLMGAADAIRRLLRQPLAPYFESKRQDIIASIRQEIGAEGFERLRNAGERADPKALTKAALG